MTTDDYSAWVGRTQTLVETIDPWRAAALAATLDCDAVPAAGDDLPPAWHWLFFNPVVPRRELGTDGHPKRGGFLPPVDLPRRMWAGGRLVYHAPLKIGAAATKTSEILKVESKSGRSGSLVFVTVRHTVSADGQSCIEEEQDIVYRSAPKPGAPVPSGTPAPDRASWSEQIYPDPTLLFRYSALTFNGHRIHYDKDYTVNEEGYADLVVQGPLTATLLHGLARRVWPARRLARFEFRGIAALFANQPFHIEAEPDPDHAGQLTLWACSQSRTLAMKARAQLETG